MLHFVKHYDTFHYGTLSNGVDLLYIIEPTQRWNGSVARRLALAGMVRRSKVAQCRMANANRTKIGRRAAPGTRPIVAAVYPAL